MKIRSVRFSNRRHVFEIATWSKKYPFPYSKADPAPTAGDPVVGCVVDEELAREAFVVTMKSGREATVHIEQILEFNRDPSYRHDLFLYELTLEAQRRVNASGLSRDEIIRRLGTSDTQFDRLLDQTNYRKSVDRILNLLHVLNCDVEIVVRSGDRATVRPHLNAEGTP